MGARGSSKAVRGIEDQLEETIIGLMQMLVDVRSKKLSRQDATQALTVMRGWIQDMIDEVEFWNQWPGRAGDKLYFEQFSGPAGSPVVLPTRGYADLDKRTRADEIIEAFQFLTNLPRPTPSRMAHALRLAAGAIESHTYLWDRWAQLLPELKERIEEEFNPRIGSKAQLQEEVVKLRGLLAEKEAAWEIRYRHFYQRAGLRWED